VHVVAESSLASVLGKLPGMPRVVAGGNCATPWRALAILDAAVPSYRLFTLNAQPGVPDRDGVILETSFVGPGMRGSDRLRYLPCIFSLVPRMLQTVLPPDVVLVQTSVPAHGTVSLGIEVNVLPAAIEAVRGHGGLVIAQLNRRMPYTYGDGVLSTDDIDLAIEADDVLSSPAAREVSDVHMAIAARVASLVPPAATLQFGPDPVHAAVLAALRGRRGLAVWSELMTDEVLALEAAGALDVDFPVTASLATGSPELYAWMDANPRVRMLRTEKASDPGLIACQPTMVSVNTALQVDLFAQANASWVRQAPYSGFGGHNDFVIGALHSPDGRAILAMPSWHPTADVSTVVPLLPVPCTSIQHGFIVSEQGTAAIWGHDHVTQAAQIISQVAHPVARDELTEAGRRLGLQLP
jgi:acyl-CoA hydrolase